MEAAIEDWPEGITCLKDYRNCIVRIPRDVATPSGKRLAKGSIYIVREARRGCLVLSERTNTLGGHGAVAARGVVPSDVEIIAWHLA